MHNNGVCRDWRIGTMFALARQGNREKTDSLGKIAALSSLTLTLHNTIRERYLGILVTTSLEQPRQFLCEEKVNFRLGYMNKKYNNKKIL